MIKHGLRNTRMYRIWSGMKNRCLNEKSKDYVNYGGRGITVCDRWKDSVENFLFDMGEPPTTNHQIDRRDNDKGYSKENCRWATRKTNGMNKRNSKTWHIKGVKFNSITDAAKHFNVSATTIFRWCYGGDRTIKKHDCNSINRY